MSKKKIIIGVLVVLVLCLLGFLIFNLASKETNSDALKFKEEYESLNNTVRESDGATYNSITIAKNNPIKYVNAKEALDILKNEKAIIYVGANWCPWCRNAVPVLFDVAKSYQTKTIYYLNLDEEKSTYEVKNKELVKTKEGTEDYYALLDYLSDYLEDYTITKNGKEYNTEEKRIYMPTIITANNGQVLSTHTGTINLDEGQTKYDNLTKSQEEELYDIYDKMLNDLYSDTCVEEDKCS